MSCKTQSAANKQSANSENTITREFKTSLNNIFEEIKTREIEMRISQINLKSKCRIALEGFKRPQVILVAAFS